MPIGVIGIVNPAGGTVTFNISGAVTGTGQQFSISRAVSGQSYSVIYSGGPQIVFVDAGEMLPVGLSSGSSYFWQFNDANGLVTVGPIQPSSYLNFQEYWLTSLLVRVIRNGVDNLVLPDNIQRADVFHAMPLGGFEALPAITINQELFQQDTIGIGQNAPNPLAIQGGMWSMPATVRNTWMMTVFAKNVETREFYRDALVGIYESSLYPVFEQIGQNISHRFQIHNYQWTDDLHGISPGFYCCDMMVDMTGMFTIGIQYSYGPIVGVLSTASASGFSQTGLAH